jgi:hypothetical protein
VVVGSSPAGRATFDFHVMFAAPAAECSCIAQFSWVGSKHPVGFARQRLLLHPPHISNVLMWYPLTPIPIRI